MQGYTTDVSSFMDVKMWNIVHLPGHHIEKIFGTIRGEIRRFKILLKLREYDLIYVFMWVTPFGTALYERVVRKLAKRLVYDIEDNILLTQTRPCLTYHPNSWIAFLKGRSKAQFLASSADYVITSSPFLNDVCLNLNSKKACTYISSSVDTNRFLPANKYLKGGPVIIGWTGTFSSRIYLDSLKEVLLMLAKRVDFKLKVIGNFDYELPGVELEVVRWTIETEIEDLQTIDIGVYPLLFDEWVLGKSGLKAIQYMAIGLPIVATNVGTTPLLISHGVEGLLVKSQEEWVNALEKLVLSPELRRELGQAARRKVVEKYSTRAVSSAYRGVLKTVMDNGKA